MQCTGGGGAGFEYNAESVYAKPSFTLHTLSKAANYSTFQMDGFGFFGFLKVGSAPACHGSTLGSNPDIPQKLAT